MVSLPAFRWAGKVHSPLLWAKVKNVAGLDGWTADWADWAPSQPETGPASAHRRQSSRFANAG